MEDDLHSLDRRRYRLQIAQIGLHEIDAALQVSQIGTRTGRQVVQHANDMPVAHESRGEMRSNKARSASHQIRCHVAFPCGVLFR